MRKSIASAASGMEWLPRAADNLLSAIANGRPFSLPGQVEPTDWSGSADRASDAYRHGAALTHGLRRDSSLPCLVYWPQGVPRAHTVALVSSRIGRNLTPWKTWFEALRTALLRTDSLREIIVTVGGTTTARYVQRAAQLFNLPVLTLVMPPHGWEGLESVRSWLAERLSAPIDSDQSYQAYVSPPLSTSGTHDDLPQRDMALFEAAERLVVLHVRRGGTIDQLTQSTLSDPMRPPGSVRICVGERLISPKLRDIYLTQGAVAWHLPVGDDLSPTTQQTVGDRLAAPAIKPASIISLDQFVHVAKTLANSGDTVLSHCTRRCYGAWPDESQDEFLDRLILDGVGSDPSPADVVLRIIAQRRLVGVAGMFRGAGRAVSFSQVPLPQLLGMRTFRSHRAAWDFEPYGICVTQSALQSLGARPVYYGDEHLWALLSESDRPFFQLRYSHGSDGSRTDWSVEREWRVIGDVPLSDLPANSIWFFVATPADALRVAAVSPWTTICCQ